MRTSLIITAFFAATALAVSSFAQTSPAAEPGAGTATTAQSGQPSAADMQKMMQQMMEMSKLNENHKLLTSLDGNWDYTIKFWMNPDPNTKPQESKGTATRKSIMGGRYVAMDVSGNMQ